MGRAERGFAAGLATRIEKESDVEPILPGGRGPAVEDVQRRLLVLGYDLGPTGVDGVFFGRTRDAVIAFQSQHGLSEDGVVGGETWATLVDETFTLGDRMLYLRLPYFHGRDVRTLQSALNTLGFSCGSADGIFGPFCERAVREFQLSCGHPPDGIAGMDTVRALDGLRHVWEGKDSRMPSAAKVAPARAADVLARHAVGIEGRGDAAEEIARRFKNLALATTESARVGMDSQYPADDMVLRLLLVDPPHETHEGAPQIALGDDDVSALASRLITALSFLGSGCREVFVDVGFADAADDIDCQRRAVRLLDAVCMVLA